MSDLSVFSEEALHVYGRAINDYHLLDSIHAHIRNPYPSGTISHVLYHKAWIDTVQWHVEDEIRRPYIDPIEALGLKRRIDRLNQERTDKVEQIDDHFLSMFDEVHADEDARINTESPAWSLDRLSILALKIFHMEVEANRSDVSAEHLSRCRKKLDVLLEQRTDLSLSINELLQDISVGIKRMKVYRQMKMYNDENLNPALYRNRKVSAE